MSRRERVGRILCVIVLALSFVVFMASLTRHFRSLGLPSAAVSFVLFYASGGCLYWAISRESR